MGNVFEMIFSNTERITLVDYSELPGTAPLQVSPAAVSDFALLNHFTTILEESAVI